MKKLTDFYWTKEDDIGMAGIDQALNQAFASGVKELIISERALECFLTVHHGELPADIDIASGEFEFWGVKIIKEK